MAMVMMTTLARMAMMAVGMSTRTGVMMMLATGQGMQGISAHENQRVDAQQHPADYLSWILRPRHGKPTFPERQNLTIRPVALRFGLGLVHLDRSCYGICRGPKSKCRIALIEADQGERSVPSASSDHALCEFITCLNSPDAWAGQAALWAVPAWKIPRQKAFRFGRRACLAT
jgi:hypothetical protein